MSDVGPVKQAWLTPGADEFAHQKRVHIALLYLCHTVGQYYTLLHSTQSNLD